MLSASHRGFCRFVALERPKIRAEVKVARKAQSDALCCQQRGDDMKLKSPAAVSCALLMFVSVVAMVSVSLAKDEKLKPEQVITKHLESIGNADKLKEVKTRTTSGVAHVDFRVGGQASVNGEGTIVSDVTSLRAGFSFQALEYPGEQFAYDGDKVMVGQLSPGNRSPLGRFVFENEILLKEGLLFGSLSASWALLNTSARQPKLDLTGLKKIGGRSLYELKYEAKKGKGNVQAWLYFDPETFRHVRSQFKVETAPTQLDKIADSAELVRYTLIEEFDQFKEVDGLTLPHSYKLDFSIDAPRGGFVGSWTYAVKQIAHNQAVDRQVFTAR
jgi:hypothetical protein